MAFSGNDRRRDHWASAAHSIKCGRFAAASAFVSMAYAPQSGRCSSMRAMGPAALSSLAACLLAGPALGRGGQPHRRRPEALQPGALRAGHQGGAPRRGPAGDAVDEASLIVARAHLERFRQTRDAHNLSDGAGGAARHRRHAAVAAQPGRVHAGPGPVAVPGATSSGAAAELFDSALGPRRRPGAGGARSRARLVGDRHRSAGAGRPRAPRGALPAHRRPDGRRASRCSPGSTAAGYWLAAAARSLGDTERAWHAALAGYAARERGAGPRRRAPRRPRPARAPRPSFPSVRAS